MFEATTIVAVKKGAQMAVAGDGQVTFGQSMIMKNKATKVRKLYEGKVVAGFAGSVADAFTLFGKFEEKLRETGGNLTRAAVEIAKEWRTDRILRKLEALLIVADKDKMYLVYCHGDRPSIAAATKLKEAGFKHVYRLVGNYQAWVDAGYAVEK